MKSFGRDRDQGAEACREKRKEKRRIMVNLPVFIQGLREKSAALYKRLA